MNRIAKKMTLSMFAALLILFTLGASTFAWISMISTVKAEGMQFEVSTPSTLLISKTGVEGSFVDSISYEGETVKNIYPVSSINGADGTFFAIDDLESINDLGRITENRTQIIDAADVTYTADGEIFHGAEPYYEKDFYLQLTAAEGKSDIKVNTVSLIYTANNDTAKNGVNSFRYAILVYEVLKDENDQPILNDQQEEVWGWVSHGVGSMRALTDSDLAYTEESKAGYSVIQGVVEIEANDTTHLDADDQPFAEGTLVVPTTVKVINQESGLEEDKNCYRVLAASEYQVVEPVVTLVENEEVVTDDEYYDYDQQALVKVAKNTKVYITKESTGIVYLQDKIERLPANDVILTVEEGETETVHVKVRMWLDGEDVNTNNAYFAKLTSEYAFSITFRLDRNND